MDNKNLTYKEFIEISYQALDLYPNIKDFLQKDLDLYNIRDNIERDLEEHPENKTELINYMTEHEDVFGDVPWLFNAIDGYEFMEYCKKRFPDIIWRCEFIEKDWISEVKQK